MIKVDEHYKIVRYLKSPIIDLGAGTLPSPKALHFPESHLPIVRSGGIKTICVDGIRRSEAINQLWEYIADGGCLISAYELEKEVQQIIKSNFRFQTIMRSPFHVIKKLSGPKGELPYAEKSPAPGQKTVCLVRYGALGDHIQMSMIIDYYHRNGWWVVYNCNRKGRDIYRGDPRINEYIDHEDGIVSAEKPKLSAYWNSLSKHYDKFINFSEIAERTLLREEGSKEFMDSWEKRHADCNRSYFDEHFVRCGLPDIKGERPKIWLSDKEKEWARKEVEEAKRKTGKSFIVLWNIMGSAFHKMYPWSYDVWFLCEQNRDDIGFITVSDVLGSYLEEKKFKNILPRSGKYTIRHTMAIHSAVDAVVTTETNSLNTGLGFNAPIVALLSHSSKDQFPWREYDIPMWPTADKCSCHPCHQLHRSRMSCPRGVINHDATLCMDQIPPTEIYENLMRLRNEYNLSDTYNKDAAVS